MMLTVPPPPHTPQLLSLTLDGLTGVSQDHMRGRFQTSPYHMMLNINLWSTLWLGMGESHDPPAHPSGLLFLSHPSPLLSFPSADIPAVLTFPVSITVTVSFSVS